MSVQFTGRSFTLSYDYQDTEQKYSLKVQPNGALQVQWQPEQPETSFQVAFFQPSKGPLRVQWRRGPTEKLWKAASVWHLAFEEPELVQKYIIPLFRPFLPEASILSQTDQVQEQMLPLAARQSPPDRTRWEALVAQLADPQYTRREAADRALRQQGPAIIPFLRSLDWGLLEAEQRFRIRRILQDVEIASVDDSPASAAKWLVNDLEIWWILLDRPELPTRRIAAERLAALLGEPIDFDPEAALEIRQAQRGRLEAKVRPTQTVPPVMP